MSWSLFVCHIPASWTATDWSHLLLNYTACIRSQLYKGAHSQSALSYFEDKNHYTDAVRALRGLALDADLPPVKVAHAMPITGHTIAVRHRHADAHSAPITTSEIERLMAAHTGLPSSAYSVSVDTASNEARVSAADADAMKLLANALNVCPIEPKSSNEATFAVSFTLTPGGTGTGTDTDTALAMSATKLEDVRYGPRRDDLSQRSSNASPVPVPLPAAPPSGLPTLAPHPHRAPIMAHTLFVSDFPCRMTDAILYALFEPFGPVVDVQLKYGVKSDPALGPNFAFVELAALDRCHAALEAFADERGVPRLKELLGETVQWRDGKKLKVKPRDRENRHAERDREREREHRERETRDRRERERSPASRYEHPHPHLEWADAPDSRPPPFRGSGSGNDRFREREFEPRGESRHFREREWHEDRAPPPPRRERSRSRERERFEPRHTDRPPGTRGGYPHGLSGDRERFSHYPRGDRPPYDDRERDRYHRSPPMG